MNLWGQAITLRGQILVSRTGDAILRVLCCVLCVLLVCVSWCWCVTLTLSPPLSPCVCSKRPPCEHSQRHTPRRFECTLFFSVPHHTARTHHDHNDIHNTTQQQHTTSHREKREKEDRERQDKKKEKKKREDERGNEREGKREDQGIKRT